MVGGGQHWSFDGGVLRAYKAHALLGRKRQRGTENDQSQILHRAFNSLNIFRSTQAPRAWPYFMHVDTVYTHVSVAPFGSYTCSGVGHG